MQSATHQLALLLLLLTISPALAQLPQDSLISRFEPDAEFALELDGEAVVSIDTPPAKVEIGQRYVADFAFLIRQFGRCVSVNDVAICIADDVSIGVTRFNARQTIAHKTRSTLSCRAKLWNNETKPPEPPPNYSWDSRLSRCNVDYSRKLGNISISWT